MIRWRDLLLIDPLPALLESGDEALVYHARRDILDEDTGPPAHLWELPAARRILKKQLANGAWPRAGVNKHPAINVNLVETWRNLRFLVHQYGFTKAHPAAERAAEYIFSCQTAAGDLRGILANQYATYYTGAILSLLILAGYDDDPRVERGLLWLLEMRQEDGGWSIPLITHKLDRATQYHLTTQHVEPLEPDRSKPFSHNSTGMVLRAFAAHPHYRRHEAAQAAGRLLASRFFRPDAYTSYQSAGYWLRFEFPFWWNNLVAALDSLSRMGFDPFDPPISAGLAWLAVHQEPSGLWELDNAPGAREAKDTSTARTQQLWLSLAICCVFKRFHVK